MKLRNVLLPIALVGALVSVANCGSQDSGSSFVPTNDGGGAGGDAGGGPGFTPGNGPGGCKKLTCADLHITCGPAGDGCGGMIADCGQCQGVQTCGGGGVPSTCGGTAGCIPKSCQALGFDCGPAGDGCGGSLDCKACPSPEICGGAGASKCGGGFIAPDGGKLTSDGGVCVPRAACDPGECGPVADGCGGILNCASTCPSGESCGGGGTPSHCGAPACTKTTCSAQGANCGFVADGCGGIIDCGGTSSCPGGQFCGGGGPNKCGAGQDAGSCVNFCQKIDTSCAANSKTRISGVVYAPNNALPLPGALVYVPNGSMTSPYGVKGFTDGVASGTSCDQCTNSASGSPLVSVTTAFDGSFTLPDVPAGVDFPLVIQLGRWRRMVTIPAVTACTERAISPASGLTRLPTRQNEGGNGVDNIPLIAISTGSVDGLECVFRKLGIDSAGATNQFSNPGGGGRIQFYQDVNGSPGATIDRNTPDVTQMTGVQANLDQYDAVIFSCGGPPGGDPSTNDMSRVQKYANKGGRVFATHYQYVWLYKNTPWDSTVAWDTGNERFTNPLFGGSWVGQINTSPGKRALFGKWLAAPAVHAAIAGSNPEQVTIVEARNNADRPVSAGAEEWITRYKDDPNTATATLHYTFNTPWGTPPAKQCGRVLFSDFHVSIGNTNGKRFPSECDNSGLTDQEKILAFFLFDLTSCIDTQPSGPPSCVKQSCAAQGINCGQAGDGCGGQQACAACPTGQVCQGNQCITPACAKTTCAAQGANCGTIPDGCGGTLNCGNCTTAGQKCGGSGPNKCGSNTCTPTSCAAQGLHCGPAGNGCGATLDCGACPTGQTCGGGGTPGACGAPNCTKTTCQAAKAACGFVADGCGGALDCGTCPVGLTCGGGGVNNQCGGNAGPH